MIRIAGIKPSIMGELPLAGRPCVIVRLAGCRLRCVWCDTPHALDPRGAGAREMPLDAVVERTLGFGPGTVLLTGGEPMDQAEAPELARRLLDAGFDVVLETGGGNDITPMSALREGRAGRLIQVVDVKCPGSGEEGSFLESNLARLDGRDRLKFVVADRADYRWSVGFLEAHGLRPGLRGTGTGDRGEEPGCGAGSAPASGRPGILLSPIHGAMAPAEVVRWMLDDRLEADLNLQIHKFIGMP